ncbi:MAG: DUF374 domain-containing protein [Candidatus Sumerlaeia bacterium]|nr:DUF374 domain-containing protein [Candidatus Sumerlaeia bacterium]
MRRRNWITRALSPSYTENRCPNAFLTGFYPAMESVTPEEQTRQRKRRYRARKFWFLKTIAIPCLWWLAKLYFHTWRLKREQIEYFEKFYAEHKPLPIIFWHTHVLVAIGMLYRISRKTDLRVSVLLSPSKDGDLAEGMLVKQGHRPIRGSSSKNAVRCLLLMRREIQEGRSVCIPVDGPRGPRLVAKEGICLLAEAHPKREAILMFFHPFWHRSLNSWDKTLIPLPFTRIQFEGIPVEYEAKESRTTFLKRLQTETLRRMKEFGQPLGDVPDAQPEGSK